MPRRKHRSTAKSAEVKTQINAHPTPVPSRAVHSSSFARYNGPITRSRTARSLAEQHNIDRLPFEVLSTIFVLSLLSDEQIVKRSSAGWPNPGPLRLCAVSSLWRTLALDTPELWSRVFVYNKYKAMAESEAEAQLVQWIRRSRSLPLTLFICYRSMNWPPIRNFVVKVLNRYASRWEALYVQYPNEFGGLRGNPLELLRVNKWSSLQRMYGFKPHDTITCAQLTHLQFDRYDCEVSYAQAVGIFRGCPRLVWLTLLIEVAPEFINVPASPIILHDLSFVSLSANHLPTMYQLVSLPSLRELVCAQIWERHQFTEPGSLRSLRSLLTRSACTLDKLEIRGLMRSLPGDLVQLLTHRSCNFLTSLGIGCYASYDVPVDDEVLQTLTLHHDNSACTHLRFLSLHCQDAQCSQSALLKMVASRVCSCTSSQPQDGLLHLYIANYHEPLERLDEVIKRNETEYEICESRGNFGRLYLRIRGFGGNVPALHDWPHDFFNTRLSSRY
jgi:hypothetical protein